MLLTRTEPWRAGANTGAPSRHLVKAMRRDTAPTTAAHAPHGESAWGNTQQCC